MPRLDASQWESVRAEREAGASFPELAARFGVSHQAIQKRAKAEGWPYVSHIKVPSEENAIEAERRRIERKSALKKEAASRAKAKEVKAAARAAVLSDRMKESVAHVYIVYCEHAGDRWYKIGISGDFEARLPAIQTGCPLPISVLLVGEVTGARNVERLLHARFAEFRVSGEWFALPDDKVAEAMRSLSDEIAERATCRD
jgi:hypothetical protein